MQMKRIRPAVYRFSTGSRRCRRKCISEYNQQGKKYLYIFTPYLIIGSEMRTALVNAAKSGVDVRLVVPGIPDKKLVYFLTQSNFPYLIKNGVKI